LNKKIGIPVLVLVMLVLLFSLSFIGVLPTLTVAGEPVFCDDYEWICCGESEESGFTNYVNFNDFSPDKSSEPWKCSEYKCEFEKPVVVCKSGLYIQDVLWVKSWQCHNKQNTYEVLKDQIVLGAADVWGTGNSSNPYGQASYKRNFIRLGWCGKSACPAGGTGRTINDRSCSFPSDSPVLGSISWNDQVSPQPNQFCFPFIGCVPNPMAGYYTVPPKECYIAKAGRHICGYTNESCSSNSECVSGHSFEYNGMGAECHTGMLQLYGCQTDECLVQGPGEECLFGRQGFCTTTETIPVQCCPGAGSCGIGSTCDPNTFTCVQSETVECNDNFDCSGWQTRCDPNTLELGGNKCVNNKCAWVASKNVECCYSFNCPVGQTCSNNECIVPAEEFLPCPFECCEDEPGYFDRSPPTGMVCCPDNSVKNSLELCEGGGEEDGLEEKEKCEARIGDGLFVIGYEWVEISSPNYLLGIIPIEIGKTTEAFCRPAYNLTLVYIVLGVVVIVALFALVWRRFK